jgi:hypothetical protein
VCELARRVTGESGKEQVRAVRQLKLPVLGEHGGRQMPGGDCKRDDQFQASKTWHRNDHAYEGANDGLYG